MNKSLIIASVALAAVALSSCSYTVVSNSPSGTVETESMVTSLTIADLDVQPQKVTATTSWSWNPFRKISSIKDAAVAEALRETGADVLVEPVYEVKKGGWFRGGSVTVTGSPAKYVNFRPMTLADAVVVKTLQGYGAVATPVIGTSDSSLLDQLKAPDDPDDPSNCRRFVNVLFGFPLGSGYTGSSIGAMYGSTGDSWGWYTKLNIDWGRDDEGDNGAGFNVTGGAIKRLPANFGIFAGIGLGMSPLESQFTFPVEVGVQWRYQRFNVVLGFQEMFASDCISKPFIGIGYCF